MAAFNEEFRYGSAAWANEEDMLRAGLFGSVGPALGYVRGRIVRLNGDAPMITIGGAGSGKLRDLLAYNLCGVRGDNGKWTAPPRMLVNDPRGELAAVSIHNQVRFGKAAYCINPYGLHDLPQLRINPWDLLSLESLGNSRTFDADLKLVVSDFIPLSGSPNGEYFELGARGWCEALLKTLIIHTGGVTMPALFDILNEIEDESGWKNTQAAMFAAPFPDIHRVAGEMDYKRKDAPKEYSAFIGELRKNTMFLSDRAIYETLSGSDVSPEVLCKEDCNLYIIIPAEYVGLLAPMQRAIVGSAMLYKQRHTSAPRVLFLIDEAAQLGRFESLLRGYTYGRGMGIRTWSIWQDTGQITRNFGREALSGFLGSSQLRQSFGTRDLDTARLWSDMLGTQTLEYDASLDQAAARRNKAHIIRELMAGADPFEAGLNYAQQARAAINRTKQARALMTPDEILNMPEDRQILFISGLGLMPVFANKYPYFKQREMAGGYMPNPYHPPADTVRVATRFGSRVCRVITERVPRKYSHLPQYQSGEWSFIEGYRPS